MRPIDAEALIEYLEEMRPENWCNTDGELQQQNDWDYFRAMIDAFPTLRCDE